MYRSLYTQQLKSAYCDRKEDYFWLEHFDGRTAPVCDQKNSHVQPTIKFPNITDNK